MADEDHDAQNIYVKPRTCLSINILVLRVLGVWFPEEERRTWRSTAYIFYAILAQGFLYYMYTLSEFIQMITVFGNIERMADVSFLLLTHIAQLKKNYAFYRHHNKMVRFLNELEHEIFTPKNAKQRQILKWAMDRARSDSTTLLLMGLVTCFLWAIFPFIEKTDGNHVRLPLDGWFPVDVTISPNFEIVFCYQMLAVTSNAVTNIAMDTTATGLFIHICGQIDMLKDSLEYMKRNTILSLLKKKQIDSLNSPEIYKIDLENIEYDNIIYTYFTEQELETEMILTYKKCVIHHEEIIRYAEDIEEIFNMCFLGQFLASVIIICLTLLKLTLVQSIFSLEFISIVLYQACIVLELLLYCWHGNEMILKSDSISNSIYNSKWYEFSPKFSRSIILLMVRSKRPVRITSGKFFFLSLPTFTAILRCSWSYFAVLNSMNEEEK